MFTMMLVSASEFGKERVAIEKKYEVIRFIRHQNRCHPAMDCIAGQLLIYRVQQYPEMEKRVVLEWIEKLAEQLELYHQCKADQPYRYLNPYSVLVTGDEEVVLLDLEAKSNEFVMRNMQKQAVRNHFVRPIAYKKENNRQFLDVYSYGKTVQFLLASVKMKPALTKGEEIRLARVVEKCLGENPKKRFEEMGQIRKELPIVRSQGEGGWKRKAGFAALAFACLAACVVLGIRMAGAENDNKKILAQLELQMGENESLKESNGQLLEENQHLQEENQMYQAENQTMMEENQKLKEEADKLREETQSLQAENQKLQEGVQDNPAEEEAQPEEAQPEEAQPEEGNQPEA